MIMTKDIQDLYTRRDRLERFLAHSPVITETVLRCTEELELIEIEIEARESIDDDSIEWE